MRNSFRMIGTVCMATAMTVCFTACSDDDETEVIEKQGRLVEYSITERDEHLFNYKTFKFTYHNDGRLAMATQSVPKNTWYYNWGNNDLTTYEDDHHDTGAFYISKYTLNDNLITDYDDESYTFQYNSSKQLIKVGSTNDQQRYTEYFWQDGKLLRGRSSKYMAGPDPKTTTYEYSGKTCKGWFVTYDWVYEICIDDNLFLAQPELIGMRTNQLPDQKSSISTREESHYNSQIGKTQKIEYKNETISKYDYKLDADGYLESYTETITYVNTTTYSFKDENQDNTISPDERNVTETTESTDIRHHWFKWE